MAEECPAPKHDYSEYSRGRCRCDRGREAHRVRTAQQRAARRNKPYGHGTSSMYDAGCRCDPCRLYRRNKYLISEKAG